MPGCGSFEKDTPHEPTPASGFAVRTKVVKSDGLAPLSDRNQICNVFGGSILTKDVFLVATHVNNAEDRDETKAWLEKNFTCLAKTVKKTYFLDAKVVLAFRICEARGWHDLPEHSSAEFVQYEKEVFFCADVVAPTLDISCAKDYESERKQVWVKLQRVLQKLPDNKEFGGELEDCVSKTWPDLFLKKVRSSVMDTLNMPLAKLEQDVSCAQKNRQLAIAHKEAMLDTLGRNQWARCVQQTRDTAIEEALDRVNIFLEVLDEGPGDWFEPQQLNDFWEKLADVVQDIAFADACKECNHHRSSRSKKGLHFDTVTDAEPFLAKFFLWVGQVTYEQLRSKLDDVIQEACQCLCQEGLPLVNRTQELRRSGSTSIPQDARCTVSAAERGVPVAAAAATAIGIGATGAAGVALATLGAVPLLVGTAVYRAEKFGDRFVKDAVYGLRRHLEGHEFMVIHGETLRRPAEEEVNRAANDVANATMIELGQAKDALRRVVQEKVNAAEQELQRLQDLAKRAKDAKELLLSVAM